MELNKMSKSMMMEKIIVLEEENLSLREKFERVVDTALPIVDEIEATKGLFRVFKIVKLTVKLTDLLIKEFRNK